MSDFLNFLNAGTRQEEDEPVIRPAEPATITQQEPTQRESGGFLDFLNSSNTVVTPTEEVEEEEEAAPVVSVTETEPPTDDVLPQNTFETPAIDQDLLDLVDAAYERTTEYFDDTVDEQDFVAILDTVQKERAEKEKILQQMLDGGRFETREAAIAEIREKNPESILLKSDADAAMEIVAKLKENPEKQRATMLQYLQSENAVTRKIAETTLRNMTDSTLGTMNGIVFADEMINPVTAVADVPMYAKGAKTAIEEGRYLDAAGNVVGGVLSAAPAGYLATKGTKKIGSHVFKTEEEALEIARRYNYGGADLATRETYEEARNRAAVVAADNQEIAQDLIKAFEAKTGKVISTEKNGQLVIDPDLARQAGRDTAVGVTERDAGIQELFLGTDTITSPILDPNNFDGIVAVASELKKMKPDAFDNNKTVIDNLLDLTVSEDMIGGQELIDMLNKYGLSFENYVLTVVGSGSDAGRVLNSLSQIKRKKPQNIRDADEAAKKAREAGDFRKGVMRIENIRRGGLVSQVATAARNLTSGAIRAPLEGLGNVMDQAIYATQNEGVLSGVEEIFRGDVWRGSFGHMKYMFSRPDVAKGYTDLILNQPQLAKQFDAMYNNINEIQKLTGRGSGSKLDAVLSEMEDVVDVLNTPNRWQEYLIRRGQFFGELERLTKREYGIDLIDTLNQGKLPDLINDASSVVPEGKPSFLALIDKSVSKALDVTYAKQPDVPVFRSASSFITRNGLTVVMPFPRFMFNSMELMGQYAGGASIPLTRKVASIVRKDMRGPLTDKDRQRISRNLMGMATVGAAYMYRSSDGAPAEYNQIPVGSEGQMDTTPTYPMAHFLYAGEATKRLKDGTFDDWFDAKEFQELFVGANLRTGVGNSILEELSTIADAADLTGAEAAGRALGRTVGNYLTTWAVPFAQIIDAERAAGLRQTDFVNVAKDPELSFWGTAGKEVKRSFQQRGFFLSPEEEAALPKKEYPFYPEGKERLYPDAKFLGATITSRPSEAGEYLMKLGFDYRDFGSRSKVPSIQAFEQRKINDYMTVLVDIAEGRRVEEMKEYYKEGNEELREEFTEEEYFANMVRPLIKEQLTAFKGKIADGKIAQGDPYARALTKYRRIQPDFRKLATTDFVKREGRRPDPLDENDLKKLIVIAQTYKKAY